MSKATNHIKYFVVLLFTVFPIINVSAQNSLSYSYDDSGNRISRVLKVEGLGKGAVSFPVKQEDLKVEEKEQELVNEEVIPSIKIYPNPTRGIINISFEGYSDPFKAEYHVFNLSGTILKNSRINAPLTEIYMNDLSDGIYFLRITINGTKTDYKIVKQN
jgi:hypothetical protein